MKKEFTYEDYYSDNIDPVDKSYLMHELLKIPDKSTVAYINSFNVEYYKIPIKNSFKLVFREEDKIFICFKQIPPTKTKVTKIRGDSSGFVKENADVVHVI